LIILEWARISGTKTRLTSQLVSGNFGHGVQPERLTFGNVFQDKVDDSDDDDDDDEEQLSHSEVDMGPCPFCNNKIKRQVPVWKSK